MKFLIGDALLLFVTIAVLWACTNVFFLHAIAMATVNVKQRRREQLVTAAVLTTVFLFVYGYMFNDLILHGRR